MVILKIRKVERVPVWCDFQIQRRPFFPRYVLYLLILFPSHLTSWNLKLTMSHLFHTSFTPCFQILQKLISNIWDSSSKDSKMQIPSGRNIICWNLLNLVLSESRVLWGKKNERLFCSLELIFLSRISRLRTARSPFILTHS